MSGFLAGQFLGNIRNAGVNQVGNRDLLVDQAKRLCKECQVVNEHINAVDFIDYNVAEFLAKILFVVALGQQLAKDLDRNQRVFQFMRQAIGNPCKKLSLFSLAPLSFFCLVLGKILDQSHRDHALARTDARNVQPKRALLLWQHNLTLPHRLAGLGHFIHQIGDRARQRTQVLSHRRQVFQGQQIRRAIVQH